MFKDFERQAVAMFAPSAAAEIALYRTGIEFVDQLCRLSAQNIRAIPGLAPPDANDLIDLAEEFGGVSDKGIDMTVLDITDQDLCNAEQVLDAFVERAVSTGINITSEQARMAIAKYEALVRAGFLDEYDDDMVMCRIGLST